MNCLVKKALLLFILIVPKMEKVFGLSQFRFQNKRRKVFSLSYRIITTSFNIAYPVACIKFLDFFHKNDLKTTFYARNLTFTFNWLLLVFILGNEISSTDSCSFAEIEKMFRKLIKLQSLNNNLSLLMRCTLKFSVVFIGLIRINYVKYSRHFVKNLSDWEKAPAMFLILIPFIILTLTSNRIYVANTLVKYFLMKNASALKSTTRRTAMQMKYCAINYTSLHSFFAAFNKSNSINLLAVLSFCMLNIVYEVIKS